ncbi:MAG: type II CAAX endopeptidase family protein [Chloroflexota bacterium]
MISDDDQKPGLEPEIADYQVPWSNRSTWLGVGFLLVWLLILILFVVAFPQLEPTWFLALGEALLLVPVLWFGVRGGSWRAVGLRKFSAASLGIGCGLMLLSWLVNLAYSMVIMLFDLQIQPDISPLFDELASPGWVFVIGVVLAPLVEELFFRGFLFAGFRQQYGWKKAAVFSAIFFSLIHMQPTAILPIFLLGLIFAYLYHISASIWPAILMHMLSNGLALGAVYLSSRFGGLESFF